MLNLVVFGPPGCGKGTQSSRIAENFGLVHLSTGEILRHEIRKATVLGRKVEIFIQKGLLVPDMLILRKFYQIALRHIHSRGLVFDGFPRTVHQAKILDKMLAKKGMPITLVIAMVVDAEELFRRLKGRAEDSGRCDDNEEVFHERMKVFDRQTKPLYDYYNKQNKIVYINGMRPVNVVFNEIARTIESFINKRENAPRQV